MRKKIEELKNREEGFTLVELLAVIVILGIIVAIAIPAIGNVINRAESDATSAEQDLFVDAGRLYFTAEEADKDGDIYISVENLYKRGYIEERGEEDSLDTTGYVLREVNSDNSLDSDVETYTYTYSPTKPSNIAEVGGSGDNSGGGE